MKITRFIASLYHKQHYDKYFMKKYADKPPLIYYDKKTDCYIHPQKISEYGCCEYICSELAKSGVHYSYYLGENRDHAHTISEVFLLAYNKAEFFSIHKENEVEYSRQELELIKNLINQGKIDRQNVSK